VAQAAEDASSRAGDPRTIRDGQEALRNRAASILGKLGGGKRGKSETREIAPERRRQIAQNAAVAKWKVKAV